MIQIVTSEDTWRSAERRLRDALVKLAEAQAEIAVASAELTDYREMWERNARLTGGQNTTSWPPFPDAP